MADWNGTGFPDPQMPVAGNSRNLFGPPTCRHVPTRSSSTSPISDPCAMNSGSIRDQGRSIHESLQSPSFKVESDHLMNVCAKQSERICELQQQLAELENDGVDGKNRIHEMDLKVAKLKKKLETGQNEVASCKAQLGRLMGENGKTVAVDDINSSVTKATGAQCIMPLPMQLPPNVPLVIEVNQPGDDNAFQSNDTVLETRHFKCNVAGCPKAYRYICKLKLHMKRRHKILDYLKDYKGCTKCGSLFPDMNELSVHRKICRDVQRTTPPEFYLEFDGDESSDE